MHSSHNYIHIFCSIQIHKHIGTPSMKFHVNYLCNLVVTIYIYSVPFKLIGILVHLVMKTLWNVNHVMLAIPTSLTLALIAMCHGTQTPYLVFDAVGFYTHWSYTCSAMISFNLGRFMLILIIIMLSYTYALYNFICFSIHFQIRHVNIILNSFKII